jgi:hypothetical protein
MLYKNQKIDKYFFRPQRPLSMACPRCRCGPSTYQVIVQHKGRVYRAGPFRDELEAAKARDRLARQLHGPCARLNDLPEDPAAAGQ